MRVSDGVSEGVSEGVNEGVRCCGAHQKSILYLPLFSVGADGGLEQVEQRQWFGTCFHGNLVVRKEPQLKVIQ